MIRRVITRRQSLAGVATGTLIALFGPSIARSAQPINQVASRVELALCSPEDGSVELREAGREGVFAWTSGNLTDLVTLDCKQGIYVAPRNAEDGEGGAWVRCFDDGIDPKWFGASPMIADNYEAITAADRMARVLERHLVFSAGTYTILADLLMTVSWRLHEETILRFSGPPVHRGRRLIQMRSYGGAEHRTARLGAKPVFPRAAIREANANTTVLYTSIPSEAANFPPGSIVRVSFGYNPYDADDPLYRYDRLNRVLASDGRTGAIKVETPINVPVKGWGFEPSGPYYAPTDWRDGETIAAGACRYHPCLTPGQLSNNPDPNLGGVFRAKNAGRTSGEDLLSDIAIIWERITNDYNGPGNVNQPPPYGRDTPYIDGRPVLELVDQPVSEVTLSGGSILWAERYPASMGVEMRSVYKCRCEKVTIKSESSPIDIRWAISEGASGCELSGNIDETRSISVSSAQDRTISVYAGDLSVKYHHCLQRRNATPKPLILVESFAELEIERSRFENLGERRASIFCTASGGGTFRISKSTIAGFSTPFSQRDSFSSAIGPKWFHAGLFAMAKDNDIDISDRQIRFGTHETSPIDLYVGNRLYLQSVDAGLNKGRLFAPEALTPVDLQFTPLPGQKNAVIPLEGTTGSLIFVSAEARWYRPNPYGEISIYPRRAHGSALGRMLTSVSAMNGRILLDYNTPSGSVSGDGTASRLVDHEAGEKLHLSYDSNLNATSGKVHVRLWVLTEQ